MPTLQQRNKEMRRQQNIAKSQIVRYAPSQVKIDFVGGNYEAALAGLKQAIDDRQPWALTAWLQCAGAMPNATQFIVNLSQELGVSGEPELRSLVESGRKLERLTGEVDYAEAFEECLELLKLCIRQDPKRRLRVLALASSHAEVIENGNGGG